MLVVNMFQAKSSLSALVEKVYSGKVKEILIARNGKPAARLVPVESYSDVSQRIGIAAGLGWEVPEDFDAGNEDIRRLFEGE